MNSVAIICSSTDAAGLNIKSSLARLGFEKSKESFEKSPVLSYNSKEFSAKLYTTEKGIIFFDGMEQLEEDFIVFISKHQSAQGVASLTMHATGNWAEAEAGGVSREVSVSWPAFIRESFAWLLLNAGDNGMEITPEVTHHGPLVMKPHAFIEIGSSEEHWKDERLGELIAKAVLNTLNKVLSPSYKPGYKVAFAIGGPHYCNNLRKAFLSDEFGVSHACPKYYTESLNEEMIRMAMERSVPKAEVVILDWKGIPNRQDIKALLDKMGIDYIKLKKI
ncbi:MAG TPA: hypothetical protein ENN46_01395 [Candidatus Woesearchaeota archaeon]|nr:hypothetical protein [Candidatus Woesearchaeota archaeon]